MGETSKNSSSCAMGQGKSEPVLEGNGSAGTLLIPSVLVGYVSSYELLHRDAKNLLEWPWWPNVGGG